MLLYLKKNGRDDTSFSEERENKATPRAEVQRESPGILAIFYHLCGGKSLVFMEERRQDSKRRCFGFAGKHVEEGALQAETSFGRFW